MITLIGPGKVIITSSILLKNAPARPRFVTSDADFACVHIQFSKLQPGMTSTEIQNIVGKPDAIKPRDDSSDHFRINLLGICANDHNEHLAYIYFIERWTSEVAR
jgi:hypothetical protein